jgi:hypothetical protein
MPRHIEEAPIHTRLEWMLLSDEDVVVTIPAVVRGVGYKAVTLEVRDAADEAHTFEIPIEDVTLVFPVRPAPETGR